MLPKDLLEADINCQLGAGVIGPFLQKHTSRFRQYVPDLLNWLAPMIWTGCKHDDSMLRNSATLEPWYQR